MAKYILAHRSCIPTAKAIREGLYFFMKSFYEGESLLVTSNLEKARGNIIINWGRSDVSLEDFESFIRTEGEIFNSPDIVRVAARRLYDGLRVRKVEWVEDETPWVFQFPIVGRDVFRMGGESVRLIRNIQEFNQDPPRYWSTYIPFDAEYRILLFRNGAGEVAFRVFRKDPVQEDVLVHNNETCKYHLIRKPRIQGLRRFIDGVVEFLSDISNTFFVGLDVGRYNDELYLIEINSAPGLNTTSVAFFTTGLLDAFWSFFYWRDCQ